MDVSVIIVNYNTKTLTLNCINSVFEKTEAIDFEIILVDNASTDGSKELFEKDKRITYIYSNKNLGFGGANNLGSKIAKGRYLFLLNSDTILIENSIKILYDYISSQNKYYACGTQLIYPNKEYQQSEIFFPNIYHDLLEIIPAIIRHKFTRQEHLKYKIAKVKPVEVVNGANIFIDHIIYKEANGFDEDYFMYYEETDLFYRLNRRGYKACVIPYTTIIHINGGSFKKKINRSITQYRSKNTFYKKHTCFIVQQFGKIILTISVLLRFPSYKKKQKTVFKAIWE